MLRRDGRSTDPIALDAWDEQHAVAGARVLRDRLKLMVRLMPVVAESYATLGSGGSLTVSYVSSWAEDVDPAAPPGEDEAAASLRKALSTRRARDLDQKTTTTGPHRDEPALLLDERPTRSQASQGEQRSVAVALRLAAYRLLRERHGTAPILLLDDVFLRTRLITLESRPGIVAPGPGFCHQCPG